MKESRDHMIEIKDSILSALLFLFYLFQKSLFSINHTALIKSVDKISNPNFWYWYYLWCNC